MALQHDRGRRAERAVASSWAGGGWGTPGGPRLMWCPTGPQSR